MSEARHLHIIMPMAGLGERFQNAGYHLPKPLIEINGRPMFTRALESLSGIAEEKAITLIFRKELETQFSITEKVHSFLPRANVIIIENMTRGAVETCLHAEPWLKPDQAVLVLDCDLHFQSSPYNALVSESLKGHSDYSAGVLYFPASHPRYSYALVQNGEAVKTAEKEVISNCALAGSYFFASSSIFLEAATELLAQPMKKNEYYVSLLYNIIIKRGQRVFAAPVETYASFGTPQELDQYLNASNGNDREPERGGKLSVRP